MVLVGALQGFVLWLLWRAAEDQFWPATQPMALGALLWAAVAVPAAYYLSENSGITWARRARLLAGVGIAYALLGAYAGWMGEPLDEADQARRLIGSAGAFGQIVASGVMGFMLLPLVCGWQRAHRRFDYPSLFVLAWRNALLTASVFAITGLFWAVLFAGSMLMESIGLKFIEVLIKEPIFAFPVTGMVVGAAFAVGHARAELLLNLRRYWLALNAWLLPLLLGFGVMWVLLLPMTGLAPLFATRHAAFTLLWFAAFAIHFINCAWQDGDDALPYPRWLARALAPAWLTLLFVTGIAGWALWLRVAQYGLTEDRVWALFVWLLAAGHALGYSLSLFPSLQPRAWRAARGGRWMPTVAPTNVALAIVAVVALALLASPLLDPRRLGVDAQVARLVKGDVEPAEFDYRYLRWESGRWGLLALRELAQGQGDARQLQIAGLAKHELAKKQRYGDEVNAEGVLSREEARQRIRLVAPATATAAPVPDSLLDYLRLDEQDYYARQCLQPANSCSIWMHDFDGDRQHDALVIVGMPRNSDAYLFTPQRGGWRMVSELCCNFGEVTWLQAIRRGEVRTVVPRWPDLQIGNRRIEVNVREGAGE
jgi:hypothetical protein